MTTTLTALPTASEVATSAKAYYTALTEHPEFDHLRRSTWMYVDCWATHTGYTIICGWNMDKDKGPLFEEAIRVLCLKGAVHQLTGDVKLAELLVPSPVDEMVHAIIAQATLLSTMARDIGLVPVHMTENEEFGWTTGDITDQYYRATWGETPPKRYWIPADEAARRLLELKGRYESAGINGLGRSHNLTFGVTAA